MGILDSMLVHTKDPNLRRIMLTGTQGKSIGKPLSNTSRNDKVWHGSPRWIETSTHLQHLCMLTCFNLLVSFREDKKEKESGMIIKCFWQARHSCTSTKGGFSYSCNEHNCHMCNGPWYIWLALFNDESHHVRPQLFILSIIIITWQQRTTCMLDIIWRIWTAGLNNVPLGHQLRHYSQTSWLGLLQHAIVWVFEPYFVQQLTMESKVNCFFL